MKAFGTFTGKQKRTFILILVVMFALGCLTTSAFAAQKSRQVTAYTAGDVTLYVNDSSFVPYDKDSGEQMDILIYQNRIYLPIRCIGEAIGASVSWSETARRAMIRTQ